MNWLGFIAAIYAIWAVRDVGRCFAHAAQIRAAAEAKRLSAPKEST